MRLRQGNYGISMLRGGGDRTILKQATICKVDGNECIIMKWQMIITDCTVSPLPIWRYNSHCLAINQNGVVLLKVIIPCCIHGFAVVLPVNTRHDQVNVFASRCGCCWARSTYLGEQEDYSNCPFPCSIMVMSVSWAGRFWHPKFSQQFNVDWIRWSLGN